MKKPLLALRFPALATLALTAAMAHAGASQAQSPLPPADGRFSITPIEGGYLKLDSRTGAVSECRRENDEFACALVPDERRALQEEIDRLATENADLRGRLAAHGMTDTGSGLDDAVPDEPPAAEPPRDPTRGMERPRAQLPDEAEVDRALDLMERFMRHFLDIIREDEAQRRI